MATKSKNKNLELWDRHCETDPSITKRIQARGGFHAIDAQAQIRNATREFGPFGIAWGLDNLSYNIISDSSDNPIGISLQADFYYSIDDKSGRFPIASDSSYRPNDDTFKKLRTDCITKALSQLGFNADVFLGLYDDNKYVDAMKKKYNNPGDRPTENKPVNSLPMPTPNVDVKAILKKTMEIYFDKCPTGSVVDMKKLQQAVWEKFGKWPTQESSVSKIVEIISIEDVIKPNDFVKGLE